MTAAQEAPPSTTLVAGKYQLLGLIGRGGMGSVWEGRHSTLGTRVAIKFIEAEYANSQDARSRFDNEARAAATIQSKHAIQIYDHGVTDDGKPYIVMEMLIGEPLEKRLDRMGRLPLQETARIIQQVSRALARAHEKGIIHRDLKPENIFLVKSPDDDDEIAKVLDFGIAKIKGNPGEMGISSSTKTGAVLGTPFYMSPEQARGLRTIDHRTDIWSLAVIAFKCATGKLPFDGESVGDLLVKICTAPPPVPSHVMPGLPPGFDAWFSRAMEREPERRFSTMQEMSEALAYAAGITMRQPNSGGNSQPQPQMQGQGQGQQMPSQMPSQMQGQRAPMVSTGGTQRQVSSPGFSGSSPALSGTQSPFTTSANAEIPKSNKGVIYASIAVAVVVLLGCVGVAAFIIKNKQGTHDIAASSTDLAKQPPPPASDVLSKQADPPKQSDPDPSTVAANGTNANVYGANGNVGPNGKPLKPGAGTVGTANAAIAPQQRSGSAPGAGAIAHPGAGTKPPTAAPPVTAPTQATQPAHTVAAPAGPPGQKSTDQAGF